MENPDERYVKGTPKHYAKVIELYGERLDHLLSPPEPATAIITYSPSVAFHLMQAALQRRLKIPQDISFVACGGGFQSAISPIPLTAVSVDPKEMGIKATGMLLEKINNPREKLANRIIHGELIERSSVRSLI